MFNVTNEATEHIANLLDNLDDAPDNAAVRVVASEQGLDLAVDVARPDDQVFEHENKPVLLLDAQLADMLADRTLDIEQTEAGPRLKLE